MYSGILGRMTEPSAKMESVPSSVSTRAVGGDSRYVNATDRVFVDARVR